MNWIKSKVTHGDEVTSNFDFIISNWTQLLECNSKVISPLFRVQDQPYSSIWCVEVQPTGGEIFSSNSYVSVTVINRSRTIKTASITVQLHKFPGYIIENEEIVAVTWHRRFAEQGDGSKWKIPKFTLTKTICDEQNGFCELDTVMFKISIRETLHSRNFYSFETANITDIKKFPVTISTDLEILFSNKFLCDIKVASKNTYSKIAIPVHRVILAARSSVLAIKLQSQLFACKLLFSGGVLKLNVDERILHDFIVFLYTDQIEYTTMLNYAPLLLTAAHKYNVIALKLKCSKHLIANLSCRNVVDVLKAAQQANDLPLFESSIAFISNHIQELSISESWKKANLDQEIMEKILDKTMDPREISQRKSTTQAITMFEELILVTKKSDETEL